MNLIASLFALFYMVDVDSTNNDEAKLHLPQGLEMGRTIRTDLDQNFPCQGNCVHYFGPDYEAYFNRIGFLDKVIFDKDRGHKIPDSWKVNWSSSLEDILLAFSNFDRFTHDKKDVTKSLFVSTFSDLSFTYENQVYHFYFISWKEHATGKHDGLSRIMVEATETP